MLLSVHQFEQWIPALIVQLLKRAFSPQDGESRVDKDARIKPALAMVSLSHMSNVSRVAIQTNMSCSTAWVEKANLQTSAFWITYHPGETDEQTFINKCAALSEMGARHSVGVVGLKDHFGAIVRLRQLLPDAIYLWVNAYKRDPDYYQADDLAFLKGIAPYFKHDC